MSRMSCLCLLILVGIPDIEMCPVLEVRVWPGGLWCRYVCKCKPCWWWMVLLLSTSDHKTSSSETRLRHDDVSPASFSPEPVYTLGGVQQYSSLKEIMKCFNKVHPLALAVVFKNQFSIFDSPLEMICQGSD